MYEAFYNFRETPFELTANPRYLYLTAQHREALSNLEYGLSSAKGITLLLGEAGTGKTTLLRAALASPLCRAVNAVFLTNPALTRQEFVTTLARRFELCEGARLSKAEFLDELAPLLLERRRRGQITALVVDEAQSLSDELLEEIRLLANTETDDEKLLPVVLAGQPELRARLNAQHLRQLKQRIALRCEIGPFTLWETADYIAERIGTAGGEAITVFTRDAVILIHEASRGIPRTINVLCDNALASGFALGRRPVDRRIIEEVSGDFDLAATESRADPVLVEDAPKHAAVSSAGDPGAAIGGKEPTQDPHANHVNSHEVFVSVDEPSPARVGIRSHA
jgi:general secretion pathway protein A